MTCAFSESTSLFNYLGAPPDIAWESPIIKKVIFEEGEKYKLVVERNGKKVSNDKVVAQNFEQRSNSAFRSGENK